MKLWSHLMQLTSSVREFAAPSYRPELHYMRGPGPAYRRRVALLEGRRNGPRFGGDVTFAG